MKKFFYLIFFIILSIPVFGQFKVEGRIWNEKNEPVIGASISVKRENKILGFTRTDQAGKYKISLNQARDVDQLILEFNHISYQKKSIPINANQQVYNFTVSEKTQQIQEVIGKIPPVYEKSDTLVYRVQQFADSIDRSIEDVLSRMPGFEVSSSGKITYNGQDISQFLIDGDDVLGSRYGVGTKQIPKEIITAIEVYRNHQPIRALKDKLHSTDVAINLKVKEGMKSHWMGEVKAGLGIPKQFLVEANTIQFNDKFKTINSLLVDNSGRDLSYGYADHANQWGMLDERFNLQTGLISPIFLPKSNFFKNFNTTLLSNYFKQLKDDWSIRLNLGVFYEKNHSSNFIRQEYTVSDQLLINQEFSDLIYKPLKIDWQANLLKNTDVRFFKNELKLSWRIHQITDLIQSPNLQLKDSLRQGGIHFSNEFTYIPNNNNKNFWKVTMLTKASQLPERSLIWPDQPLTVLPTVSHVLGIRQDFKKNHVENQLMVDYQLKDWKNLKQSYGISSRMLYNTLNSNTNFDKELTEPSPLEFNNELAWSQYAIAVQPSYFWDKPNWKITLKIPFGLQSISYKDDGFALKKLKLSLLFNPKMDFQVNLATTQKINGQIWLNETFGEITDIYQGYILSDFRTIRRSNSILPNSKLQNYYISYQIEMPGPMLFLNMRYNFTRERRNLMIQVNIDQDKTQINYIDRANYALRHDLNAKLSKYIHLIKASSSLEVNYSEAMNQQLFNEDEKEFLNKNWRTKINFNGIINKVQWTASSSFNYIRTEDGLRNFSKQAKVVTNNLSLSHSYKSRLFSTVNGFSNHLIDLQNKLDYYNLNFNLRYKGAKKFEYEFTVSNIFNQKNYEIPYSIPGILIHQGYRIRGRNAMFQVSYKF